MGIPVRDLLQSCNLVSAGTTVTLAKADLDRVCFHIPTEAADRMWSPVAYGRPALGSLSVLCLGPCVTACFIE